jgi:hypothetical protein
MPRKDRANLPDGDGRIFPIAQPVILQYVTE